MMAAWVSEHLYKLMLCVSYIIVSTVLIRFNKHLMKEDHFPFSMALTALHMAMSMTLCGVLYVARPSAFPGVASTEGRRMTVAKWFLPIGFAFAIALYFSNKAYIYCNVVFLQCMKESNVISAYLLSCAAGLQVLNRIRAATIFWVLAGCSLSVYGEVHFVLVGFLLQMVSQVADCSRVVLGEMVLSGSDLKLDPLTYTLFCAPVCLCVLLVGNAFAWDPLILERAAVWWPYLLANASLAFLLNVLVATVIKETSAVGFILTGVMKDIFLVLFSAIYFGEEVSKGQALGFTMSITGVFFWSFMKTCPKHPAVRQMEALLGMPQDKGEDERAPLLAKAP